MINGHSQSISQGSKVDKYLKLAKDTLKGLVGIYVASLDGLLIGYVGMGDPDRWAALTATLAALGSTYVREVANLTMSNHKHEYTLIRFNGGFIINFRRNDYAITIIDKDPNELNAALSILNEA